MATTSFLGDGPLGQAIAAASRADAATPSGPWPPGRPGGTTRRDRSARDVVVDASRAEAVARTSTPPSPPACRRVRRRDDRLARRHGPVGERRRARRATAVVAPNLALGAALFLRLVDEAARLAASIGGFEPSVVEWHRRTKADRPSGTAREIVRRLARRAADRRSTRSRSCARARCPGCTSSGFDGAERDDRAPADRPRPVGLRGGGARRDRLAARGAAFARRSMPSTRSSTT